MNGYHMRSRHIVVSLLVVFLFCWPFSASAGPYTEPGIASDSPGIQGWASGWLNEIRGPMDIAHPEGGNATFGSPDTAVGPATCNVYDVVSLGDGGELTLTFGSPIYNGPGYDLVLFENGFSVGDWIYAELAFVEVSTDGVTFARFPSISLTPDPVAPYGLLDPTDVFYLAGKHPGGNQTPCYGTGFDLASLETDPAVQNGEVNLDEIRFVKVIDVIGNGSTLDATGSPIYDPYPTAFASGGFDLQAVGALHMIHCTDQDGDGFSIEGGPCGPVDCDDTDPNVHPFVLEGPGGDPTCRDGLDNDCDGKTDNDDPECGQSPSWPGAAPAYGDSPGLISSPLSVSINLLGAFLLPVLIGLACKLLIKRRTVQGSGSRTTSPFATQI